MRGGFGSSRRDKTSPSNVPGIRLGRGYLKQEGLVVGRRSRLMLSSQCVSCGDCSAGSDAPSFQVRLGRWLVQVDTDRSFTCLVTPWPAARPRFIV